MGGGLRKHVLQLINGLDTNIFEIYLIHGTDTLDRNFLKDYSCLSEKCHMIKCPYLKREMNITNDILSIKFIKDKIKEINPDIVHCHSSKAGAVGRVAAKFKGIRKIYYTPHAYSFLAPEFNNKKKYMFVFIEKILSRFATTKTFCVSESEFISAINRGIDKENKFTVIKNGISSNIINEKNDLKRFLGIDNSSILIGNNARLSEQKNPMLFMEIAQKLIRRNSKFHFLWVGNGPLFDQVQEFINKNKLSSNIHLLGERDDAEYLVYNFDIFLITSLYEGLPYSLIESLRAGVPIVGFKCEGVTDIIKEGINGFYFDEYLNLNVFDKAQKLDKNEIYLDFKNNYTLEKMIKNISSEYLK
ncbi:glycosyltransferase family 1 protein [Enterococcus casseliflavus]|nr:glycosyltransferase family 1 protein [Enterococcus casseliflavus]